MVILIVIVIVVSIVILVAMIFQKYPRQVSFEEFLESVKISRRD